MESAYAHWIKRFIFFHNKHHPAEMAEPPWQAGLPGRTRCEATVRRPHHRKSVGVYLNLLPLLYLSLTKRHTRHRCANLQNA